MRENALILSAAVLLSAVYSVGFAWGETLLPRAQWTGLFMMVLAAGAMVAFLARWATGARSGPVTTVRMVWSALAMFLGYSIYSGNPALDSARVTGPVTGLMLVSWIVESRLRSRPRAE